MHEILFPHLIAVHITDTRDPRFLLFSLSLIQTSIPRRLLALVMQEEGSTRSTYISYCLRLYFYEL